MRSFSPPQTVCLSMTREEWEVIDTALAAYSHNATFRKIHEKLDNQVASSAASRGVSYTPRLKRDRRW